MALTDRPAIRGLGLAVAAAALAAVVTAVVLVGFSLVSFPAYGNSNVLRALTVVGQTAAVALVVLGMLAARAGERPGGRALLVRLGKLAAPTGSAHVFADALASSDRAYAFAAIPAPSVPAAPGRFSTTTDCDIDFCRCAASMRPIMSAGPPAENGTMIRRGFVG